ncbi:MAG: hypothetical protein HYY84_15185 [Deltaproteobacteria bacterium]|nr:hypothetical protein [Deltaproteobacteria bacterium]
MAGVSAGLSCLLWAACVRTSPLAAPPETAFSSTPSAATKSTIATFSFFCVDAVPSACTFTCKVDEGAEGACVSPLQLSGLAEGAHTLSVRATNGSGVADTTPATYTWTIDTTAPTVTFTSGPAAYTNATTATINFTTNDLSATISCAYNANAAITCFSQSSWQGLADGTHTFIVQATDSLGNASDASVYSWTIDTTAPDTSFDGGPAQLSNVPSPTFSLACSDPPCTFVCTLDDASPATCASTHTVLGLGEGSHSLAVHAIDLAGNVDPSDAIFSWLVDLTAPTVTIEMMTPIAPYGTLAPISGFALDSATPIASVRVNVGADTGIIAYEGFYPDGGWEAGSVWWSTSFVTTRFFHVVTASATDFAGNAGTSDSGVVHSSLFPASAVIGQPSFTENCASRPSELTLSSPSAVLFAPASNRLFVADRDNGRVVAHQLSMTNRFTDYAADFVLGRPSLTDCADGGVSASTMTAPSGLAYDSANERLFVADRSNSRVLVYEVSTLTSGEPATVVLGQADFDGSAAATFQDRLGYPSGLAYDPITLRLFVADNGNNRVMIFVGPFTNGMLAVNVLGQPTFATNTGGASATELRDPADVAFDPSRSRLFVADRGNHRVVAYEFDASISNGMAASNVLGQPNLTSGDAGISATQMSNPSGLALDVISDRLYVADSTNHRVLVFAVGTVDDGEAAIAVLGQPVFDAGFAGTTASTLSAPRRIALDADGGRLYVADQNNSRVVVFDVATLTNGESAIDAIGHADSPDAGNPIFDSACENGPGRASFQDGSRGLAIDLGARRFFAVDGYNSRVLVFSIDDAGLPSASANWVLGQPDFLHCEPGLGAARFDGPNAVVFDFLTDRLFVADNPNNRVLVFSTSALVNGLAAIAVLGQPSFDAGAEALSASGFNGPTGLALDSDGGRLFVVDTGHHRVMVFDVASIDAGESAIAVLGQTDFVTDDPGTSATKLWSPEAVAYDPVTKRLFVADESNNRVMVFDATSLANGQAATIVIGQPDFDAGAPSGGATGMNDPEGVAYDTVYKRLFVSDPRNNRILVFDGAMLATGVAAMNVIGQYSLGGDAGGLSSSKLLFPGPLAIDPTGRWLFASDMGNGRILVFDVGP